MVTKKLCFQSNNNKKPAIAKKMETTTIAKKGKTLSSSVKKFFASGTPAATGQTWLPPVKEIFDSKTGRKLTDLENAANDDGDGRKRQRKMKM